MSIITVEITEETGLTDHLLSLKGHVSIQDDDHEDRFNFSVSYVGTCDHEPAYSIELSLRGGRYTNGRSISCIIPNFSSDSWTQRSFIRWIGENAQRIFDTICVGRYSPGSLASLLRDAK